MLFVFYMPLSSMAQTPQFFIIPQHPQFFIIPRHQPLISIPTMIYTITLLSHWRSGGHQQLAKQFERYNNQKITYQKEPRLLSPSYYLLCLPSSVHSGNLFQCNHFLHHPSHNTILVLHNTQTNRIAYPCIPCSSDGHVPVTRMQKVTANENSKTKKQNPKNLLCSHYQGDLLFGHNVSWMVNLQAIAKALIT